MNKQFLFLLVALIIGGLILFGLSMLILGDNIKNCDEGYYNFYIKSNHNIDSVENQLVQLDILKNSRSFRWVADKMNYPNTVEAGKFTIPNNISNKALVSQLRNGYMEQSIDVPINLIHNRIDLYSKVSAILELEVTDLKTVFENDSILNQFDLDTESAWGIVLADTYKFYWDTDAFGFFNRMLEEYQKFWNNERKAQAAQHNLDPLDAVIIASIIEKESVKPDEYRRIAGVYLNRLNKDWPLQADPTVKFALNQPELKRILHVHLEVDSPYNTYKYPGLPPGPIGLPQKTTIDAVLQAESHDYMYFCAKADFSGYHTFAKTHSEHRRNARKYQKALNDSGIY